MKKVFSIISILFVTFLLAGCTTEDFEAKITDLEAINETLVSDKETLEESKTTLLTENNKYLKDIAAFEDAIELLEDQKAQLEIDLEGAKSDDRVALETQIETLNENIINLTAELSAKFDGAFILKTGDDMQVINYVTSLEKSLFTIIDEMDIAFEYQDSDFGHFVTAAGSISSDAFHYVSLQHNGAPSMVGIDDLVYENGDIIEFTAEWITWDTAFEVTLESITSFNSLQFVMEDGTEFFVQEDDLPEGVVIESLLEGSSYIVTGVNEVASKGWGCSNCVIPTSIEADYINDFTALYDLEIGEEVYLEFTITELSNGWQWGTEMFVEDVNGVLSKDVTDHLLDPYSSGYLFYTMPDELDLNVGTSYVAKFTFDLYPPNSKGQLGLAGINADGTIDYNTVEFYELNEDGSISHSVVTWVDPNEPEDVVCSGFQYVKDNMSTGDQCTITFTVDGIVWGTPQATDLLGTFSEDVMAYIFDPSWGDAVVGTSYTVVIEKQSNGQIKLIGDLTVTGN